MKHRFKSVAGAVRRVRELDRQLKDRDNLLDRWKEERVLLAKLASDKPEFNNPIVVADAKRIRDQILAQV